VGEDGKAGVRGRLVSKQGAMIAKSLTAGFLSGFAQALDTNPVPVINTNPTDTPVYQQVFNENTLQSGISKGASSAIEKVAQFYLDMAEGMFPVIEVDAGRQIDVIITKGQQLKLKSQGTK
jgi:conjugal transfer pilus assembly protein TraB